jgi:hypothetical protein
MRRPVSGRDAVGFQVIDVLEAQIKRRPAMKKVSTEAAKQSRKISEQKLTVGLDLGDRSSWYCVLDEAGAIVLEQKLGTTPKAMKEVFGGMACSRIALETGMHSPWVSRLLSALGHEVIVAHARNLRLIGEPKEGRSAGCANVGAAGPNRSQVVSLSLPSPAAANNLLRYEAHLDRKLCRDTESLERRQAQRKNGVMKS